MLRWGNLCEEPLDNVMENTGNERAEELMYCEEDAERTAIRTELSTLSFEELQQLKERLGSKLYNEAMFGKKLSKKQTSHSSTGVSQQRTDKPDSFKRSHSKKPRQMSSKVPVSPFRQVVETEKRVVRDPRFEDLCGTFNEKGWEKAYSFLEDMKTKEYQMLKSELKDEKDVNRQAEIKYLMKRMDNQQREKQQKREKEESQKEERKAQLEMLTKGKTPQYESKAKKLKQELASQYHHLKSSGRIDKYIKRKRQRVAAKDRKSLLHTQM